VKEACLLTRLDGAILVMKSLSSDVGFELSRVSLTEKRRTASPILFGAGSLSVVLLGCSHSHVWFGNVVGCSS
jgi:hypothetical protein